jgi:hypothetical protein
MDNLCKYKDIFGKPKEGAHSYRVFDIAIVDVIFTILGGIVIAYIFNLDYTNTIIILFILGIVMHRLFCVETTVDKFLFSKS